MGKILEQTMHTEIKQVLFEFKLLISEKFGGYTTVIYVLLMLCS